MKRHIMIASLIIMLMTFAACSYEPDTPLAIATAKGDNTTVRVLLSRRVDVNQKDSHGYTALMWAARHGHTEAVKSLIDAGADMNLRDCASTGWPALIHAIHKNQNEAARLLIDRGADVNARAGGCQELRAEGGATPLMYAAGYDNTEIVKALLEKGADPYAGANGSTVLSEAVGGAWDIDRPTADKCPTETVKVLLEKAPKLKLTDGFWDRAALFFAKRNGCSEVISLLEKGRNSQQVAEAK